MNIDAGGVYLIGTGRYLGESRGVSPAKYAVVRFTERRMNRDRGDKEWDLTKIRSRREGW